ncbi:MAG TPA: hypothetical protein VHB68_10810 [Steroidobacteraceae bacterium]|nr:hypothetical protein [Steroidobacteraceae bacterium]
MNSRKPKKQTLEQVNQSLFEELQLQLVVPDQTQEVAHKARRRSAGALSVRLPAVRARTIH